MKQINKQKQKKVGVCLLVTFGTACFGGVCLLGALLSLKTRELNKLKHKPKQPVAVPHYNYFLVDSYEVKLDNFPSAITDFDNSFFEDGRYGFSFKIGSFKLQKGVFYCSNVVGDRISAKCYLLPRESNLSPWWLLTKDDWSEKSHYLDLTLYVHYDS